MKQFSSGFNSSSLGFTRVKAGAGADCVEGEALHEGIRVEGEAGHVHVSKLRTSERSSQSWRTEDAIAAGGEARHACMYASATPVCPSCNLARPLRIGLRGLHQACSAPARRSLQLSIAASASLALPPMKRAPTCRRSVLWPSHSSALSPRVEHRLGMPMYACRCICMAPRLVALR
jgi:hypothetical protein